jgi:hypothetical protein
MVPRLEEKSVSYEQSQKSAARLDRIEDELILRGLFSKHRIPDKLYYQNE